MAQTYTPGLTVAERMKVQKDRILPIKGDVLVSLGDVVDAQTIVAKTELPGEVYPVNIANRLGIGPKEVEGAMLKHAGDSVVKGEVIAQSASFFGIFKSRAESPRSGTIEAISDITGQVIIRGKPLPVEVKAYVPGKIASVRDANGVTVSCMASLIQGIFGIGGESTGTLRVLVQNPEDPLEPTLIDNSHKGSIIVGGSFATAEALKKAAEVGAKGVVVGGFDDRDLFEYLGYDLGVAITGSEDIPITLVVTEGFGKISMAQNTFRLLKENDGRVASINGATQIRAGVIRPEVVIPQDPEDQSEEKNGEAVDLGLRIGGVIRCIRNPYFGRIGEVTELPQELFRLESGTMVRILKIRFEDGEEAIVPRANVEAITGNG